MNDDNETTDLMEEVETEAVDDTAGDNYDDIPTPTGETASETMETGSPPITQEHRDAIGSAMQQAAQSQGIDMAGLARQLGLSADSVDAMTHGDLLAAARHLAADHPEIAQKLLGHLPLIGGMLGSLFGARG